MDGNSLEFYGLSYISRIAIRVDVVEGVPGQVVAELTGEAVVSGAGGWVRERVLWQRFAEESRMLLPNLLLFALWSREKKYLPSGENSVFEVS